MQTLNEMPNEEQTFGVHYEDAQDYQSLEGSSAHNGYLDNSPEFYSTPMMPESKYQPPYPGKPFPRGNFISTVLL